jgi:hypothetical protein
VLLSALVSKVITDDETPGALRATGVELLCEGSTHVVEATREVILSAG